MSWLFALVLRIRGLGGKVSIKRIHERKRCGGLRLCTERDGRQLTGWPTGPARGILQDAETKHARTSPHGALPKQSICLESAALSFIE